MVKKNFNSFAKFFIYFARQYVQVTLWTSKYQKKQRSNKKRRKICISKETLVISAHLDDAHCSQHAWMSEAS